MDLKGKTVFVTGSSRGIGAACAEAFAKKGANVIVNGRHGVSDELVKKIEANGVVCKTIIGDISVAEDVKRMTKEAYEAFETIDVLVNNAGIQHVAPIPEFPADKWMRLLRSTCPRPSIARRRRCLKCRRRAGAGSSTSPRPMV